MKIKTLANCSGLPKIVKRLPCRSFTVNVTRSPYVINGLVLVWRFDWNLPNLSKFPASYIR